MRGWLRGFSFPRVIGLMKPRLLQVNRDAGPSRQSGKYLHKYLTLSAIQQVTLLRTNWAAPDAKRTLAAHQSEEPGTWPGSSLNRLVVGDSGVQ